MQIDYILCKVANEASGIIDNGYGRGFEETDKLLEQILQHANRKQANNKINYYKLLLKIFSLLHIYTYTIICTHTNTTKKMA